MDGEAGGLLTSVSAIKYTAQSPKRAFPSSQRTNPIAPPATVAVTANLPEGSL